MTWQRLRDGSQEAVSAGAGRKLNGKPTLSTPKGHESDDFYFTFKCKAFGRDGEPRRPPQVVDADRKDISGTLIGNGSIVNVKFNEWLNPATDKHVLYLNGYKWYTLYLMSETVAFKLLRVGSRENL